MPTLKKISEKQMRQIVPAADFAVVSRSGEHVFLVEVKGPVSKTEPLVNVEIALRKGERVGLFSSEYASPNRT
ncbi:hypothetical protein HY624_01075 [Candidatus Uhrbacteria bacterium]|nr:hypothetical protein [Candidatus Uhrbacteria bacterium]